MPGLPGIVVVEHLARLHIDQQHGIGGHGTGKETQNEEGKRQETPDKLGGQRECGDREFSCRRLYQRHGTGSTMPAVADRILMLLL